MDENNKVLVEQVKAVEDLNKMIVEKAAELPSYNQKALIEFKELFQGKSKFWSFSYRSSIENAVQKQKLLFGKKMERCLMHIIANDTLGKSFAYSTQEITGNLRTLSANYNPRTTNVEVAAKFSPC